MTQFRTVKRAISAVVDDFVGNVAADGRINARFAGADIPAPQADAGRPMASAHRGMNISEGEFNALVGDLVQSLDKFKVPEKAA